MYPISDPFLKELSIKIFRTSKPSKYILGDLKEIKFQNNFLLNENENIEPNIPLNSSKLINDQNKITKENEEEKNSEVKSNIEIEKEEKNENFLMKSNIIEEKKIEIEEEKKIEKKYKFKVSPNDIIKLPENYSTDDEDEYNIISIFNEPLDKNWKLAIDDKTNKIKVYKKELEGTKALLLKAFGEIPYSLKTIMEVLDDYDFRMKWDKTFKTINLIERIPKGNNEYESYIQYSYMKFPAFMTDRDFVQKFKLWRNYLGNNKIVLNHNKSVSHNKFPEKSNPIRAEMIIGGYYFEEINNNLTKGCFINHADVKVETGVSLVNKKAPESPQNFIKYLINGCNMWVKTKK